MSHPAEIGAMEIHRFFSGIENVWFSTESNVFLKYVNKHVRMFHIGLAVRRKVRHLSVAEVQIPFPDLVKPGAITTTEVAQ